MHLYTNKMKLSSDILHIIASYISNINDLLSFRHISSNTLANIYTVYFKSRYLYSFTKIVKYTPVISYKCFNTYIYYPESIEYYKYMKNRYGTYRHNENHYVLLKLKNITYLDCSDIDINPRHISHIRTLRCLTNHIYIDKDILLNNPNLEVLSLTANGLYMDSLDIGIDIILSLYKLEMLIINIESRYLHVIELMYRANILLDKLIYHKNIKYILINYDNCFELRDIIESLRSHGIRVCVYDSKTGIRYVLNGKKILSDVNSFVEKYINCNATERNSLILKKNKNLQY